MPNKYLSEIKTNHVRWLNLSRNTAKEIDYLRENFKFHPLDLDDCLSPAQRPKLDEYDDYLFLILTFPYYDHGRKEIRSSELDFFIGQDYLVTVTDGQLEPFNKFFEQCRINDAFRDKYLNGNPVALLSEILTKLQAYLFPMLDHINLDIEDIEKVIFAGYEKKMVKEILLVKRNIINFRKITQTHQNVIKKLIRKERKFFIPDEIGLHLANNLEQSADAWDILDGLKENIEALHGTNESLISFRLNDIMKILTMISVVLLPVNLVASIFGMNTPIMPFVNDPGGFWMILGLMGFLIVGFIIFFKKKNWL
ncbi:MAG TPA: magnesium/cobalt transporter CorA [Patescibacteria group bacterium]|nr:magnesium/cobalt transporter CorA [Patescibacteria group bacterium]